MLQSYSGSPTELGPSAQAYIYSSSPCKLQPRCSTFNSKSFTSLNPQSSPLALNNSPKYTNISHVRNKGTSKDVATVPFRSKIVGLTKNTNKGRNKKYGGILPSILRALESEKDIGKALDLYYGRLSPKEQTVILKEQRKWDKVLKVFEYFKSQKDYIPNIIHYNVVLRALGRARKWDDLRLCWIEMAKMGVFPTNNTYSMLVDVYGKAGLVKEAVLWIKYMKMRGVFPDEVTMSTVVKVLKDAGEYDKAHKFYKDWCAGKIELHDLDLDNMGDDHVISFKQFLLTELFRTGVRSHSFRDFEDVESCVRKPRLTTTYNTLIDLYGKAGRLKEASDIFGDMLKNGVALDTFTFNTMIYTCGSRGYLSESEALLSEMEERGISPDTKTYNIFLSLYADVGNIDAVLQCYKKIREVGLFPDDVTHRAVVKILSERNMVEEVESVIQEMEKLNKRIDESSLPVLAKMYVGAGLLERVKSIVDKSQSCGGFSSNTCAAIIDVYAENGLWAEAEALFYGTGRRKDILEYNVMIKAYGMAKLYDKAVSLFRGMRNQGKWPDDCTYNSLIQMLAGGELVEKARDFLAEMQERGFKPACSTFSAVIAGFAKKKMLSHAVEVFDEMSRADVKPNEVVYGSLIDAFAEDGNFEEANHYFHLMEGSGISANQIILTSMIKAYGKIGSLDGAKLLYEKLKKFDGGPDIVASNSMLNLYAELGMVSEAKALFDFLREKKDGADGVTFATMMYVYKNMGMLDEAIEVAEEMKRSGLMRDCVTFNKVMACYATNGQLVECGELLHEMLVNQKLSPDAGTFKVVFTILKKGGMQAKQVKQLQAAYKEGRYFAKQAAITSVFSIVGLHEYALKLSGFKKKKGEVLNLFGYNAAIGAFVCCEKFVEALKMFTRMQDEGVEPDAVTLMYVVNCYGKVGMVEGVKRVSSLLKNGEIERSDMLYKAVIKAYEDLNRHDLAEMVSQEMKFASDSDMEDQLTDSEGE